MSYIDTALKVFGSSIKMGIEERKLSIKECADRSGVCQDKIKSIIQGEDYMLSDYIKVARVLQIHIEFSMMDADNNIMTMGGNKPNMN